LDHWLLNYGCKGFKFLNRKNASAEHLVKVWGNQRIFNTTHGLFRIFSSELVADFGKELSAKYEPYQCLALRKLQRVCNVFQEEKVIF
jgi:hypothetical protein